MGGFFVILRAEFIFLKKENFYIGNHNIKIIFAI
ncbi:hypothetical protein FLACOL_00674 [Flavobacterium columnare]|uniref:Uncharacterized protein n=1 Tax=Flavobacterium columnare TaxID=996 RepID=A0A2N9P8M7_9FLAO|nr:hypothetical protein FLACOL_00674 [Flavobacterium columnare]